MRVDGKAAVPIDIAQEGPLVLQLKQVQIMFRHGARTPLHTIPKLHEANYDKQFMMREHQTSLFSYDRLVHSTGQHSEWSDYEPRLTQPLLKGGVCSGALTTYGKEQMYLLGQQLQLCYRDSLNLATYDPNQVLVLSSNIKRTVESARCILAGFFGKEQLRAFAEFCFPVKIFVIEDNYNILIPGTVTCPVLRKVNHTMLFNSDILPKFKDKRMTIEKIINAKRERRIESVKAIQNNINSLCNLSKIGGRHQVMVTEHNQYRQPYLCDPSLQPLVEERDKVMAKVDRLWSDAMVRNQYLSQILTQSDINAFNYLRKVIVERFEGKFRSGYRFHFHFDDNPYFYNDHLCKEVYINNPPGAKPSWSKPISWKECTNLLKDLNADGQISCECQETKNVEEGSSCKKKKETSLSFFHWYTQPTCAEDDSIGHAIRDEVWNDPMTSLEGQRKFPDKWEENFNFVSANDDIVCRAAHGMQRHKELKYCEEVIRENASQMLHYAMSGQVGPERLVVSRLSAGPLLTQIVSIMNDMIKEKESTPRLCFYSTHDSTMTAMLEALGIWYNKWPPFASDLRFELYKDVNSPEHYVRILYCGNVQMIRHQMADYMHWNDFKTDIMKYLISKEEYMSICSSDILETISKNKYSDAKSTEAPTGM